VHVSRRLGLTRHLCSLSLVDGTTRGELTDALGGKGGMTVTGD
jgi:hypothetical protein